MIWFDRIRLYYEKGLWNKDRVRAVVGNVITEDEYKEITGEDVSAYGGSPDPSNTIINNKWN